MKIIKATIPKEIQAAFEVRKQVFIEEQGVDPAIEHDQYDNDALHIVGFFDEQPIAVARIQVHNHKGKIQRVAILKPFRNQGYGKQLMLEIEQILKREHVQSISLNAQAHVIPFYQSIGYTICSAPFYEAGIEHVAMIKE